MTTYEVHEFKRGEDIELPDDYEVAAANLTQKRNGRHRLLVCVPEDGQDDAEGVTCAGTTADGEPCTREVDEPGDVCWDHEE